jgi:uncharacterized protein YcbX
MADTHNSPAGKVAALWRYPVKSMMGEELNAADVTGRGLLGDRARALIDAETGKVVSAKNPRKWPGMFDFRAAYVEPPHDPKALPPVRIAAPDGTMLRSDQPETDGRISAELGRAVRLAGAVPGGSSIEGYWPDHDWLAERDQVFEVELPPGTFFDLGLVHLVTTATLDALRALAPRSRFETRRFRPNVVIQAPEGVEGFVENDWIGRTLAIGDEVRLRITRPCPRCVMTTLPQGDLPRDPAVLRTAVQNNQGNVGVYADVLQAGRIRRGDAVVLN